MELLTRHTHQSWANMTVHMHGMVNEVRASARLSGVPFRRHAVSMALYIWMGVCLYILLCLACSCTMHALGSARSFLVC